MENMISPMAVVVTEPAEDALSDAAACAPALEIRIARSLAEVEAIRGIWSLWKTHRDSDIDFCTQIVWQRDEFIRPHVITLYRHGRPDAMLVGRLEYARVQPKIGYLRLPGMRMRSLAFAHGSFLGNASPENSEQFVKSIMEALANGEADSALLHQFSVDSPIYDLALRMPKFGSRDHFAKPAAHNGMRIADTIDEVLLGFSSSLKADVRRKKKRLIKDFGDRARYWTAHEPAELDAVIPQIEEVASKSYQRGLGVGFQDTPQMRSNLRIYSEKGWLRIYLLSIDNKVCAYWIGTAYERSFCSDYLAFDTNFGNYSPGTLLLMEAIEDFCKTGVKEVDFGGGAGRYKERFGNFQTMESSVWIFAPSLRGLLPNFVQTASGAINAALTRLLERTQLLPKIKKFWRAKSAKANGAD